MSDTFRGISLNRQGILMPNVIASLLPEQLADLSNGCGPASMKVKLIPDSILGVDFFPACSGHDACYAFGEDEDDKRLADRIFLFNLLAAVDEHCIENGIVDRVQRVACREAAFAYYKAVADWGKSAFWAGKEKR